MPRTSMSLPAEFIRDLNYVSKRMGITKSALLTQVAQEGVSELAKLFSQLPEDPTEFTEEKRQRLRGDSILQIEQRYKEVQDQLNGYDLFANK